MTLPSVGTERTSTHSPKRPVVWRQPPHLLTVEQHTEGSKTPSFPTASPLNGPRRSPRHPRKRLAPAPAKGWKGATSVRPPLLASCYGQVPAAEMERGLPI